MCHFIHTHASVVVSMLLALQLKVMVIHGGMIILVMRPLEFKNFKNIIFVI